MQTLNPYILILQQQFYESYDPIYVQYAAIPICIIFPFIIGRLMHDKHLTHLLDQVNNQQIARKQLSQALTRTSGRITALRAKKRIGIVITGIVFAAMALQMYRFTSAILINFTVIAAVGLAWALGIAALKYLTWRKQRLEFRLKRTNLSTEEEVKVILAELGDEIQEGLKLKFDREIELQRIKEDKQECKLYKCYTQKQVLTELNDIYKQIIGELQKFVWCDVCNHEKNISTIDLRLLEIENAVKVCAKASIDPKITLDKRKQITNRVLGEWTKLSQKLPHICKRGCCLKFKVELDEIKNKYHGKIKAISAKLH